MVCFILLSRLYAGHCGGKETDALPALFGRLKGSFKSVSGTSGLNSNSFIEDAISSLSTELGTVISNTARLFRGAGNKPRECVT